MNYFWQDSLESQDWWDLTNERNFIEKKKPETKPKEDPSASAPSCSTSALPTSTKEEKTNETSEKSEKETKCAENKCVSEEDDDSDSELFASDDCVADTITKGKGFKLKLEQNDRELFCTGRTLGTQDYVGQRVLQIAQILRNLSFTEDNTPILGKNRTFLRFLLLCIGSRWNSVHQLGLDMLSNVSSEIILKEQMQRVSDCLLTYISNGLHSEDRTVVIACLETLNKLSLNEKNEEFMLRCLEQKTYAQVCSFLTLHDVMLLIYTLECLYSLSSLGEKACNFIVEVHGIIDTLVSLVTVEGKSYGPKACIGMKLVETVSGVASVQNTTVSLQAASVVQTPVTTATVTTTARVIATPTIVRNVVPAPQNKTIISTIVSTTNSPACNSVTSAVVQAAPQSIQQQHAHQQAIQENEQFALAYLRATYEPCTAGKIEQQELYKQYLNACAKIGRRGVIAPLHFPRCVR